ncbi:MAG: hypothetical protein ACOCZT_03045, partial [Halanaerobiales bacterium]
MKLISNKYSILQVILFLVLLHLMSGFLYADLLESYSAIDENEHLILFINHDTTEIAVQDKNSGQIWYSNPPDRNEMETIAKGNTLAELNSQLLLSFYLPGNRRKKMNTYSDSIAFNQFEINKIDNGVNIDYIIGEQWSDEDFVPIVIGKDAFEEKILDNLSEEDSEFLLEQYHLLALKEKENSEENLDIHRF